MTRLTVIPGNNDDMRGDAAMNQDVLHTIETSIVAGTFDIALQPVFNLRDMRSIGLEALVRFDDSPESSPSRVLAAADVLGRTVPLELAILRKAIAVMDTLAGDQFLAINISPDTVISPDFQQMLNGGILNRVVLEITEHSPVTNLTQFKTVIAPLRTVGLRVAIDDVGAGHSGLLRIAELQPDMLKLDRCLIIAIDQDPARRALIRAIASYADECGISLIAEGIETAEELSSLKRLGIAYGQGFFLGRPKLLSAPQ